MSAALVVQCVQAKRATRGEEHSDAAAMRPRPTVELAFYRKYTEGTLRRFMYRSMEIGKVPSLLGDFSFRAKSSNRRGYTFEDSVIFVHDIERCLKLREELDEGTGLRSLVVMADPDRELHPSVLVYMPNRKDPQEYTLAETAAVLRTSVRSTVRRYEEALDRLTRIFLRRELMQVPGNSACQAPEGGEPGAKLK